MNQTNINSRVAVKTHLLLAQKSNRTLVRCGSNNYKTPLFSFDSKGLYIRCKDCREQQENGDVKRGAYHLIPWTELMKMSMGLVPVEEAHNYDRTGQIAGVVDQTPESPTTDSVESGTGDTGGQLERN